MRVDGGGPGGRSALDEDGSLDDVDGGGDDRHVDRAAVDPLRVGGVDDSRVRASAGFAVDGGGERGGGGRGGGGVDENGVVADTGDGARREDVHVDRRAFDARIGRGRVGGGEGGRVDEDRVVPDDGASVEVDVESRVVDSSPGRAVVGRSVDVNVVVRRLLALDLVRGLTLGVGVGAGLFRGDAARLGCDGDRGSEGEGCGGVDDGEIDGGVADPCSAVEVGGVGALDLVTDTGRRSA